MKRNISRAITESLAIFSALFILFAAHAVATPGQWSFAVLGDSRGNPELFNTLLKLISEDPATPKLVVHTGDMVSRATKKREWRQYQRSVAILGDIPMYPVCGNHETILGSKMKNFIKYAKPPGGRTYYSFKHKNAGFVILNTYYPGEHGRIGEEQLEWLDKTLEDMGRDTSAIFVFLHKPLMTRPDYHHPEPLKNSAAVEKILESGGVDAVFAGHEHRYDHQAEGGVHHFIAAGAGAPLYGKDDNVFFHYLRVTVADDRVTVIAVGQSGAEMKRVIIPL